MSLSHVKTTRRLNEELEGYIRNIDDNRRAMKELSADAKEINKKLLEEERKRAKMERERKRGAQKKLRMVGAVVAAIVKLTESKKAL